MRDFSQFKRGEAWPKWPNGKYAYDRDDVTRPMDGYRVNSSNFLNKKAVLSQR